MPQHIKRKRTAPLGPRGEIPVTESECEYSHGREIDVAANVPLPLPHPRMVCRTVQLDGGHSRGVEHVEPVTPSRNAHHVLSQESVETAAHKDTLHGVDLKVTLAARGNPRCQGKHSLTPSQCRKLTRRTHDRFERRRIGRNERTQRRCALIVRHLGEGLAPSDSGFNGLPTIDAHRSGAIREPPHANPPGASAHASLGGNDYLNPRRRRPQRPSQEQRSGTPNPRLRASPLGRGVNPCGRRLAVRRPSVDSGGDSACSARGNCGSELTMRKQRLELQSRVRAPGTREPLREQGLGGRHGHDTKERHRSIAARAGRIGDCWDCDLGASPSQQAWARRSFPLTTRGSPLRGGFAERYRLRHCAQKLVPRRYRLSHRGGVERAAPGTPGDSRRPCET